MGEHGAELQNEPLDVSEEFARQQNHFFIGRRSRLWTRRPPPARFTGKAWP